MRELTRPLQGIEEALLELVGRHGSPLYVLDRAGLRSRARAFTSAFARALPGTKVFYALKSNNHPEVSKTLVRCGLGLDASSGAELQHALETGARDILLSGPGKTNDELELALAQGDRVTIQIDSFGELARLQKIARPAGRRVRCGVRLTVDEQGLWRKFGIPLADLGSFLELARRTEAVSVEGLQFHTSWNLEPGSQVAFLERIGTELARLPDRLTRGLGFVDVGGGFWPPPGETVHAPEDGHEAQDPRALELASRTRRHMPAAPLNEFADAIARAAREHVFPTRACTIWTEPGRWLCHDAMHVLLTVVDKKAPDLVIVDAGTNALGWERLEHDFFPVVNLSRPALTERPCLVLGSLCTPHDVWGYSFLGRAIEPGDVLAVPSQGAYTYSLRQEFIKPLPKVAVLPE